ncbi:hypothetical protein ABTQ07_20860, partial [Acinetobacter baumannii]
KNMVKKLPLFLLIVSSFFLFNRLAAQQTGNPYRDSIVQLYGVVMTADSLRGLPAVSVIVEGRGRGTITSNDGVFSIAVLKGDRITFS